VRGCVCLRSQGDCLLIVVQLAEASSPQALMRLSWAREAVPPVGSNLQVKDTPAFPWVGDCRHRGARGGSDSLERSQLGKGVILIVGRRANVERVGQGDGGFTLHRSH
jgi:hypothetical protein